MEHAAASEPHACSNSDLQFGFSGKNSPSLLSSPAAHGGRAACRAAGCGGAHTGASHRKSRAAPFAVITLSSLQPGAAQPGTLGCTRAMPLFVVASAAEAPPRAAASPSTSPSWAAILGNLLAGATAGCAVEAALYPIDTIKTRLQAMVGGGGWRSLLQQGGGKALYAGVWGNLAGVAPSSAIFIAVYEPVKHAVYRELGQGHQFWGPVVAGAAAGAAASLTRVPTEVIKQRLQTGEFRGAASAVRSILTKEGFRGLYAGYGAFMMRDLPFDAIEFVAYEQLKLAFEAFVKRDLNPAEVSLCGAVAGGVTGIVTTPLDVLKTRLMTQGASGRYAGLWDATVTIARTEGMGAFLSGWQPRLIWISLGGFVFFPVLEAAKKFFAPKPELEVAAMKV